jgi:hypothetical protein
VGISSRGKPHGTPAIAQDRALRRTAHKHFDVLWTTLMRQPGWSKESARSAGYAWLSEVTQIPPDRCHMGMLHGDDLRKVIASCRPYSEPLFEGR